MTIAEQRSAVVAEAMTWLRTPYHHAARVKGAGVDCAMLPAAVYTACGLIDEPVFDAYPPDWHMHRDAERYLATVLDYAVEIETDPLPGDLVLWRFGRCFSHGAIVIEWPTVIHAYLRTPVSLSNALQDSRLTHIGQSGPDQGKPRPRKAFTLKQWAE
jgi:cell wall-associated NlpC family hydrolase